MKGSKSLPKINTNLFLLFFTCVISISLIQSVYAQTSADSESQTTISENLSNDPVAQDLLKKIEQTKKMIDELKQKEFEENQAKENLQKMRDISVERLNQNLDEWERLWEQHSSRNSFEKFVNKKPSYVQGVFWDQFEFKEQKVNAGRVAMNKVLTDGGTMHDAKEAYNKAATMLRVELIEMNSQFNVKHNLADHEEQRLFNSLGQIHSSPAIQVKLTNLYSDYKTQPGYILANLDATEISGNDSDLQCDEEFLLVYRITTGNQSCVDESTAKKWMRDGIKGIVIVGGNSESTNDIKTNPGTQCKQGHQVVYHVAKSEYQCVSESDAKQMLEQNIAKNHTLIDYIASKDDQKAYDDIIYEINQKILNINKEFDVKNNELESKYDEIIKHSDLLEKQKTQDVIGEYKIENITKEEVDRQISKIRGAGDALKEKILDEKTAEFKVLESEKKKSILDAVKGYEGNSDIDIDWDSLNESENATQTIIKERTEDLPIQITLSDKDEKIHLDNVGVVNSFGHEFDEIKTEQVL
ncbi:MAG: hypothetical protein GKS07_08540 [Nitrosopumilus sp.]|nr:MAG: hypothetical protein GKS07_08540 [Nitrosopumilus sp.]